MNTTIKKIEIKRNKNSHLISQLGFRYIVMMFLYHMDCVENYELWRKWTEREKEEVASLSEWA